MTISQAQRHAAYMDAHQRLGDPIVALPDLTEELEHQLSAAEWFALNAVHHALTAALDALVVLHDLTGPEDTES